MHEDAGIGLCEAPTQPHEYTVWQHPFRDLRIYLHSTVLRAISVSALESLKSKESSEIGGILHGTTSVDRKGLTTIIAEAEFVPSEGPLYNRSQVDYESLLRALNRQTNHAGLSIIGYFRSHIREDLCLSKEDEGLITRNIRDPNSLFLLVRPFDIGACMAAFFFWENGKLQTDGSDLEVPFLSLDEPISKRQIPNAYHVMGTNSENNPPHEPACEEAPTTTAARTASHVSMPPELNEAAAAEPVSKPIIQIPQGREMTTVLSSGDPDRMQSRERSSKQSLGSQTSGQRGRPLFALAIAFVFLALVIGGVFFTLPALRSYLLAAPIYSRSTPVGLSVSRAADGHLDISWNRDAPEFARGQSARITITDGPLLKEVDMDNAQLHLGKLAYFPNSPDVQFRLEVYLDSRRSLAESVRVISPTSKTTGVKPIDQPGRNSLLERFPVHPHARTAPVPPNGISVKVPRQVDSKSWLAVAPNKVAPQIHKETLPPEVPLLSAAELIPPHSSALTSLTSAPPFVTPLPASKMETVISQANSGSAYVPPRPIKRVIPDGISIGPVPVVYETTQIEVEVNIDATGRVTEAHPVQKGNKANMRLTGSAVSAATQWKFEPATLHGKPIAALHTLVFVFHPRS